MSNHPDMFKVVEIVDGKVREETTTGPYRNSMRYNDRKRVFHSIQQARTYRERVKKVGGDARIIRYAATGEVE